MNIGVIRNAEKNILRKAKKGKA